MLEKLENLFGLIESKDFEDSFSSLFKNLMIAEHPLNLMTNVSSFVLKDGHYELSMNVDKDATEKNVDINLDKNNVLSINYHVKTDNSEQMVKIKETLPVDANADTIDATIQNGKLVVTADLIEKKSVKVNVEK